MFNLFSKLHSDDAGSVTLEYIVLMTFVGLGVIVGAQALGSVLNDELVEVAEAVGKLDQSYSAAGYSANCASKTGSSALDTDASDIATGAATASSSQFGHTVDASFCNGTDDSTSGG